MEEYGYVYNKFLKDVKKYSSKPNLSIKNNDYSVYVFIVFVLLFCIIARYC